MFDILSIIPSKKKHTSSGWYAFNAVCCHHRGHKPDRRARAGIIFTDEKNWSYNCFNCNFKCGFVLGNSFTRNTKQLLEWCGVDKLQIEKYSFESFSSREVVETTRNKIISQTVFFTEKQLPDGAILIDESNPEHQIHIDYLVKRGLSIDDYQFYCVPNESRIRIIIPYYYSGKIVGHTSRYYDNRPPKYISDQQRGYVFNIDNQQRDWATCILVEGQFDAISIGGCGYLGSTISDEQAQILTKLRRQLIVVPDRDKSGMQICDRALELGYQISLPDWAEDVKDVNDAVVKYGKLPTLLSILQSTTTSKIKIELARKKYK